MPTSVFNSCNFGTTIAHTGQDINVSSAAISAGIAAFNSCTLASTTEISATAYTFLGDEAAVGIQRKDDTDGAHLAHIKQAIVSADTTLYRTASPSVRLTPKSASITSDTHLFPFSVRVSNGQTCTPTVYVRESESGDGAAYNGSRAKLYVRANYNLGITSDTLLDTATAASDGAWEGLTGTTAAVTDDGVLQFYITFNGTTGWINMDDLSAVNA
jgi:hypothetical protein